MIGLCQDDLDIAALRVIVAFNKALISEGNEVLCAYDGSTLDLWVRLSRTS